VEQRAAPDVAVEGRRLRGVIPYDVESRDLGGWRERIAAGALAGAELGDLVATLDHAGVPLGRYPGTLVLEERADGVHWAVELRRRAPTSARPSGAAIRAPPRGA
jgi:hypothetical protein